MGLIASLSSNLVPDVVAREFNPLTDIERRPEVAPRPSRADLPHDLHVLLRHHLL